MAYEMDDDMKCDEFWEKGEYDRRIHSNPDARAWAKFYCETYPDADEETMVGWFANAMMAMYDYHIKGKSEKTNG
jgi:hypothetical protein